MEKRALGGAYLTQTISVPGLLRRGLPQPRTGGGVLKKKKKTQNIDFVRVRTQALAAVKDFAPRLCAGTAWRLRHRVDPRPSAVSVDRRVSKPAAN